MLWVVIKTRKALYKYRPFTMSEMILLTVRSFLSYTSFACSGHRPGLRVCVGHWRADGGGGRLRGNWWYESIQLWHYLSATPGLTMCSHSLSHIDVFYCDCVTSSSWVSLLMKPFAVCPVHVLRSSGGIQRHGVCEEEGHIPCGQL